MTIKYLLLLLTLFTLGSDKYPKIEGRVTKCSVDFNYTSEIKLVDNNPTAVINTIANNKPEPFCLKWTNGNIFCDNRDPCIITAVGELSISAPYPLDKTLISIGTASRCSTYISCYVDKKDLHAATGKQVSEMTCYNANGETSKVMAVGQYSTEFKTSLLEITVSPKTSYLVKLTNDFKLADNQPINFSKVSKSTNLNELLSRYEQKDFTALNDWVDSTAKFSRPSVYYLIDNNSDNSNEFKFISDNLSDVALTKFPSVMVTPSKKNLLGLLLMLIK